MPSQSTKSTSPHQSWRVSELPLRQFMSCVLVDVDDTLDNIFSSDIAIGRYVTGGQYRYHMGGFMASTLRSGVENGYTGRCSFP